MGCEHYLHQRTDFGIKLQCVIMHPVGISIGSAETIIRELLLYEKVCSWWNPKMLTFNQKAYCIDVSAEHPALIWI
jgi:hypothetical protein